MAASRPLLALTQGDPAGIGPEILLKVAAGYRGPESGFLPLLVAERAALEAVRDAVPPVVWERLLFLDTPPDRVRLAELATDAVPVLDPVRRPRSLQPGRSGPDDARGALAALDAGIQLASSGAAGALVTAPVSKESIARQALPGFTGHTDYLAEKAGLERYGRDYLMAFLAPNLRVALLSTHLPLREALDRVTEEAILEALLCLDRHAPSLARPDEADRHRPRIAVAGLNPHAGEGGLLGNEELDHIAPAIAAARSRGIDAHGPESPDSLFARARRNDFDWILALYHDQGLIAVKTAAFGEAVNLTLGLPYLRTSVDHGTAFPIAGKNQADPGPLAYVVELTLDLLRAKG